MRKRLSILNNQKLELEGKRASISSKDDKRTASIDPFETVSLERLDRQEDMKFMLRLKRERTDDVILPKQYYYSMSV